MAMLTHSDDHESKLESISYFAAVRECKTLLAEVQNPVFYLLYTSYIQLGILR